MDNNNVTENSEPKISRLAIYHFKGTVTWIKITAISLFIFTATALLFLLYIIFDHGPDPKMIMMFFMTGLTGVLGYLLNTVANRYQSYSETYSVKDIEDAAAKQKSYWIIIGVLAIIEIIALLIALIGSFNRWF